VCGRACDSDGERAGIPMSLLSLLHGPRASLRQLRLGQTSEAMTNLECYSPHKKKSTQHNTVKKKEHANSRKWRGKQKPKIKACWTWFTGLTLSSRASTRPLGMVGGPGAGSITTTTTECCRTIEQGCAALPPAASVRQPARVEKTGGLFTGGLMRVSVRVLAGRTESPLCRI
jgi:hypothetical protein